MSQILAPVLALSALSLVCAVSCSSPGGTPTPADSQADLRPRVQPSEPALANVRQITFAGLRSGEGYFDSDGGRMVFQSEREPGNPFYQIYLLDLRTGAERRVSTGAGKATCGWVHPNGTRVLFASTHLDEAAAAKQAKEMEDRESGTSRRYSWDFDEHYDLFVRDLQTDGLRAVAPAPGYDAEGSWSPDGRWMVFASNRHAYAEAANLTADERERLEVDPSAFVDLYVVDARGRNLRRLTDSPGYDGGPFFSADGRRIVWRRFSEDGANAEVYSMAFDGDARTDAAATALTRLGMMSWAPFFHPSGDYVIFTTNLKGMRNFELYAVDARGEREPVRVTHREGFDGLPSFTADGRRLTWTSQRGGDSRSQIFVADWNDELIREQLGLRARRDSQVAPILAIPETRTSIEETDLRAHIDALTSDAADGRLTGTPGERIATSYVARALRAAGIEPAGDHGTFFQEFGFTAGVSLGDDNRMALEGPAGRTDWEVDRDWRPLAFSAVGVREPADVVFAGYGIVSPAGEDVDAIDQYQGLDVADRWVVVLRGVPAGASKPARRHLRQYDSLRYKAMLARDRGAVGIVFVTGPRSKVRSQLANLQFDASLAGTSIAAVTVSGAAAQALFATGEDLDSVQARHDDEWDAQGFAIDGVRLGANIDLRQQRRKGRNVLGRLQVGSEPSESVVVVGAHVDHLGRGRSQGSLAQPKDDRIHRGADDNASGIAAILEMAEQLAHQRDTGALAGTRDILFGAWSGEELGLLGSSHFLANAGDADNPHDALADRDGDNPHDTLADRYADNPHDALADRYVAYLNLDMVGRREDEVYVYGFGSSSVWAEEVERANAPVGLSLVARQDSYLATDATPFYLAGVPILSAFTGVHEDYHRPSDVAEKLDYAGLRDTARLWSRIAASLSARPDAPDYLATKRPTNLGQRAGIRIYLGTIPDYAQTDLVGVRLSGVSADGPADEGGLRAGDVIVEVAGRAVENIYDYTFALGDLEAGESAVIVVERDGSRLQLIVVPVSRD